MAIDSGFYYKLFPKDVNLFRALDVNPPDNICHLAQTGNLSGQLWRIAPAGNGFFTLSTQFRGPDMCADIFNGGPNDAQVHLTRRGNLSGQSWLIRETSEPPPFTNSFFARLSTEFRGPDMCLDRLESGETFFVRLAARANTARQVWLLSRTDDRV